MLKLKYVTLLTVCPLCSDNHELAFVLDKNDSQVFLLFHFKPCQEKYQEICFPCSFMKNLIFFPIFCSYFCQDDEMKQ